MPLLSASADTFILGATVCLVVFAYRASTPASTKDALRPKYSSLVSGILVIHTLYMIYILSFKMPPNLFTRLHLPLSMPSQKIRTALLARMDTGGGDVLPENIEDLLMKLNTFDLRIFFVRLVLPCVINLQVALSDQPGSGRTRFKNASGVRPSQSTRHILSSPSFCLTSKRLPSSGW
jgi:hypothetical protein